MHTASTKTLFCNEHLEFGFEMSSNLVKNRTKNGIGVENYRIIRAGPKMHFFIKNAHLE